MTTGEEENVHGRFYFPANAHLPGIGKNGVAVIKARGPNAGHSMRRKPKDQQSAFAKWLPGGYRPIWQILKSGQCRFLGISNFMKIMVVGLK